MVESVGGQGNPGGILLQIAQILFGLAAVLTALKGLINRQKKQEGVKKDGEDQGTQ